MNRPIFDKELGAEMLPFPDGMASLDNVSLPMLTLMVVNLQSDLADLQLEHERLKEHVRSIKRGFKQYRRYRFRRY